MGGSAMIYNIKVRKNCLYKVFISKKYNLGSPRNKRREIVAYQRKRNISFTSWIIRTIGKIQKTRLVLAMSGRGRFYIWCILPIYAKFVLIRIRSDFEHAIWCKLTKQISYFIEYQTNTTPRCGLPTLCR